MRIKVDYEECKDCAEKESCELLKEMKTLIAATVEVLWGMTHVDDKGMAHPNEVQS